MPWYVYALLASLLFAVIPLQKRKSGFEQKSLMFWSSIFSFILTLFLIPFLEFPDSSWFYFGAVFTGLTGVFGGILQFKMSEKRIGRTMALQIPIQIVACFVFFSLLQPESYATLTEGTVSSILVLLSIVCLSVASQFLRKGDSGVISLISVLPVSLLFAVIIVYYKVIMQVVEGSPGHIILAYIMVHYFTVSACFLIENIFNKKTTILISEKLTASAMQIAVLYVFAYYFMFLAIYHSINPAFVLVFNLLVPVWIGLYSFIFNKEDDSNMKVAVIMLLLVSVMLASL